VALPRALSEFIAEANEILEALGRDLLILDENRGHEPDPELLNGVFRAAHSLKGLSSMFGQDALARLSHQTEDLLDALRLGKVALDEQLLDGLIETLDVLNALLVESSNEIADGPAAQRALGQADRLLRLLAPPATVAADALDALGLDPQLRAVFTEYEEHRLRENVKKGVCLFRVRAVFSLADFDQGLAQLNAGLKPLGEVISTLPSSQPGDESSIAFDLVFGSGRTGEEIEAATAPLKATVMTLATQSKVKPEHLPPPSAPQHWREEATRPATPDTSLRSLTQTVRVDIGRLDGLMNAVGELLLIKSNIQQLAEGARQAAAGALPLPKLWGQELFKESRALERKLDELQKGILEVRMVPLGQVFDKLARLVRRIVRESGKEIDFDLAGGDVELDKLIVEELSDPLMHLLRNAIDHGVEAPQARLSAGKSRKGVVRLKARQQGNHVVLEVGDDGAGMNEARIREVAIQRELITPAQAQSLERRELLNLVFLPGFSTRKAVSELSGRGVGLDVVKTNLARLSGIIDIDSRPGAGTTFVLTLPLTLAIIRALVVEVSGRIWAVPLNSVLEIAQVRSDELRTIERREVFALRGQTVPFVRLSRVFGLPQVPLEKHQVVVVGLAQQRVGLAVDQLLGQQDIVTKPLGGRLRKVPGVAGATDLGNRRTVLVLDVASVIEELLRPRASSQAS
jgi:two-component system chemotaxis sensor kinase CheA